MALCLSLTILPARCIQAASKDTIRAKMINILYNGKGGRLTCDFDGYSDKSKRHEGIDFACGAGTEVHSLISGTVVSAFYSSNGLSTISIYDSTHNKSVIYLHTGGFKVKVGQNVTQGQVIALESKNGADAVHTHVEVRDGRQTNASPSRDSVLANSDPYPYWDLIFSGNNPTSHNPVGHVDNVRSNSPGTITVYGWAFDGDAASKSIGVHVYVGGKAGSGAPGYQILADKGRPDVNNAYGISGHHGFESTLNVNCSGMQTVYIYAINEGMGNDNPLIGTTTVNIQKKVTTYAPQGCVDIVSSDAAGKIRVRGWAFDKDVPSTSLQIHVYVGGPAGSGAPGYVITANQSRPDVNNAYKITGNHGFDNTLSVSKSGKQTIYIYAINAGGGSSNSMIGSKTVTINQGNKPQGCVDLASSPSKGTLRIAGWAFDKDVSTKSIQVHVYVGGPAGSGAPGYAITANKSRPDVNNAYKITGNHGFDNTLSVSKSGKQTIYIYAINEGGGSGNPLIGTKTVTIK